MTSALQELGNKYKPVCIYVCHAYKQNLSIYTLLIVNYFRLSGLSPFAGENDIETLKNVKACDWDFDEEAFANVSEEGRDFIKHLLVKNKE